MQAAQVACKASHIQEQKDKICERRAPAHPSQTIVTSLTSTSDTEEFTINQLHRRLPTFRERDGFLGLQSNT